jgi:hypothetical protein
MSVTNRRPLARTLPSGAVLSEFHDGHGQRTIEVTPSKAGVTVTITHADGRRFEAVVPCR